MATLIAGLFFDVLVKTVNPYFDYLRFMEPPLEYENILQVYVVFFALFKALNVVLEIGFELEQTSNYFLVTIMINFVFRQYVYQPLVKAVTQLQQLLVNKAH